MDPNDFIFPAASAAHRLQLGVDLRQLIRQIDPKFEQKSLRRGALQAMSKAGTAEVEPLEFSGHTNTKSLRRYLQWNLFGARVGARGAAIANLILVPRSA